MPELPPTWTLGECAIRTVVRAVILAAREAGADLHILDPDPVPVGVGETVHRAREAEAEGDRVVVRKIAAGATSERDDRPSGQP